MSSECSNIKCPFHPQDEPFCHEEACHYRPTLTDFLLSDPQSIFLEFIKSADELGLEYVYKNNHYLWIKGNTNIALTAHVDTVDCDYTDFEDVDRMLVPCPDPKTIVEEFGILRAYRKGEQTILGGDDRVGVHLIYDQFQKPLVEIPHMFLFNGEEVGGIGAESFVAEKLCLDGIDLMLSLDSPYNNEFVWYGNNRSADTWVESFGWKNRGRGIFTDIMIIGEHYNFPMINLGIGYFKQHTNEEYIDIEIMEMCRRKLNRMMQEYIPIEEWE
jgi:hypothetical protein